MEVAMPIRYEVHKDGHMIHAVAEAPLTPEEFIEFEIAHAIDDRIKAPVSELFEISASAFKDITMEDMQEIMRRRGEVNRAALPHRCAICLDSLDDHTWNLAKFYEGMAMLHSPETVIVFANASTAKIWLGCDN